MGLAFKNPNSYWSKFLPPIFDYVSGIVTASSVVKETFDTGI
jgi:hypothetical protein